VVDGQVYSTAEHFMMACKARLFEDWQSLERILESDDPKAAKHLGRQVRNFCSELWERVSQGCVILGNVAKFSQNPELKAFLLGTAEDVLVEASPTDSIWGIGLAQNDPRASHPRDWLGQNLLGFALMAVRETLRSR